MQSDYKVRQKKILGTYDYLGMTLIGHKALDKRCKFSLTESQTGWEVYNDHFRTVNSIDMLFDCFVEKAKRNNITKERITTVINAKLEDIKKRGIKTPLNS